MEKIAERVGIYDVWAVFFPGSMTVLGSLITVGIKKNALLPSLSFVPNDVSKWIVFILASLFCGLVQQEIGRLLKRWFKLRNAADGLLQESEKIFTKTEIDSFQDCYTKYGKKNLNSRVLFHLINMEAQRRGYGEKFAKLNVMQNMALSLAVAMIFGTIDCSYLVILSIVQSSFYTIILYGIMGLLCIFMTAMFINRYLRFNRYWVRNIVYSVAASINSENEEKCN